MKLSSLLFAFLYFLCDADAQQLPSAGLLIRPATINYQLGNGQTENAQIFIINNLQKSKQFSVYLSDWIRDSLGVHVYTPPGANPRSCASWITIDKDFLEIAPGQTAVLDVRLRIPDTPNAATEMKWAMLFLETTEEQVVETDNQVYTVVNNKVRVGIHLYQTPPQVIHKDVRIVGFNPPTWKSRRCRITCVNSGEVQLECTSYIELSNLETGVKTRIDAPLFPLFPDQRRLVEFELPMELPPGKYSLVGVIDAGKDVPLEAVQQEINIE
ncbi:hypothetical protein WJU16_25245 [Chitinophaga pollutisoli]|uniref:P pilus assembly chaperone PapD n=1 Tax=Chitinophaga pollutisoli TaxID=3133966 RepID=A0ABZ2YP51_9BACT